MYIVLIIGSYLFGSISSAKIIGNLRGVDLTRKGTKNPGATNVYKLIGPFWGIFTGCLDFLKGVIPTFLARDLFNYNFLIVFLVALGAIIGHNWPLFYNFEGGRGLATTMGTIGVINLEMGFYAFTSALILTWLLRMITKKDIRIAYIVYPLFTVFVIYFCFSYSFLFYGIAIILLAGIRAWQVRKR